MRELPIKKLVSIAFLTAPLFGLLGAMPALFFARIDSNRIPAAFLLTTGITLIFWFINILLLWAGKPMPFLRINWARYIISVALSLVMLTVIFDFFLPRPAGSRMMELPTGNNIETIRQPLLNNPAGKLPAPRFVKFNRPPIFFSHIQTQSLNIIVIILLELLLLRNRKQQIEYENNQLRLANLEARNNQLKQQIHPHFLFNSLSVLRSLIRRSPDQAEQYVNRLSHLLRFSTTSDTQTMISLSQEIELTVNYLNMQKVRFGDALFFHVDVPASMQLIGRVPVYAIQQLAENAIKHNILTVQEPLHITIKGDRQQYKVTVTNNLQQKQNRDERNGTGLVNLGERYRLLANERIEILKEESAFSVTIKVIVHENSNS